MDLINIIKENISKGEYSKAYDMFLNIKKENDFNANEDAKFEYAKLLYLMKKNAEAACEFREIILKNKNNLNSLLLLSKIYMEKYDSFRVLKILFYIKKSGIMSAEDADDEIVNALIYMKKQELAVKFLQNINNRKYDKLLNALYFEIMHDMKIKNAAGGNLARYKKLTYGDKIADVKIKNVLLNEYEIYERKIKLLSFPRRLSLSVTNKCNLRCKMCLQRDDNFETRMIPPDKIKEIESYFPYLELIIWTGGEAFLHPQFEDLIDKAGKYNIKQLLTTNGLLITDKLAEKFVRYNFELTISMDSVNKNTYEFIRAGAKFDVLLEKINIVNKFRNKNNAMKLFVQYVVSKYNYKEDFLDVIEFCNRNRIEQLTFLFDKYEKDADIQNKIIERFNACKKMLVAGADSYGIKLFYYVPNEPVPASEARSGAGKNVNAGDVVHAGGITHFKYGDELQKGKMPKCFLPWKVLSIDYNCNVFSECFGDVMGNLYRDRLSDIWNGAGLTELRKNILNGDLSCRKSCRPLDTPDEQFRY